MTPAGMRCCSAALCAVTVVLPQASSTAVTAEPATRAHRAGHTRETSVHTLAIIAITRFVRPIRSTVATNWMASHACLLDTAIPPPGGYSGA